MAHPGDSIDSYQQKAENVSSYQWLVIEPTNETQHVSKTAVEFPEGIILIILFRLHTELKKPKRQKRPEPVCPLKTRR